MRYLQNISNWSNPGGQNCNVTKTIHFDLIYTGNFPGKKQKATKAHKYAQHVVQVFSFIINFDDSFINVDENFLVKLNMQKIYFKYFSFINFDGTPQKHIKLAQSRESKT